MGLIFKFFLLINMWVMPSARSCSNSATFPGLLTTVLPAVSGRSAGGCYQPYRVSPDSRTSTIFSPVVNESGVDRPVMNG